MSHPRPAARNGFGVAAFVLGLLGLVFGAFPVVGAIAWPLVVLGLAFGVVGLVKARRGRDGRGWAVAGLALSVAGIAACVLWAAVFDRAATEVDDAMEQLEAQADQRSAVVFEVTGDAPTVTVDHSAVGEVEQQVTALPWRKEFTVKGVLRGGTLGVTTGPGGGTATCRVTVDGVERKTATATGPNARADCSDF